MKHEKLLLSKAIHSGGVEKLISRGITSDHFSHPDNQEVWSFINKHISEYKYAPSYEIIHEEFPEYEFPIAKDSIEYLFDKCVIDIKRREAVKAFQDLAEIIDENDADVIKNIDEIFLDKAKDLTSILPSSSTSKFSAMKKRIQEYKERKEHGLTMGIPFGIDKLDDMTLGIKPHQYITLAGATGMGKTSLGLNFAVNHYMAGYTPMIISLEMGEQEVYNKLDSIAAKIQAKSIEGASLSPKELNDWQDLAEKVENLHNDIIVIDIDYATPERIYAETSRWNPDILIVDYVQLLLAPKYIKNKWDQIDHVSRELKRIARQLKVPVYGLAQTNTEAFKDGAKLENVGGARAIGHHSDIFLGLHQDKDMREMKKMVLDVGKNRGGEIGEIELYANHATGEYREWKESDIYNGD